jgi:hypothetical protein
MFAHKIGQTINVFIPVRCRESKSQARRAKWHGWRPDGGNQKPVLCQKGGS